MGNKSSTNPCRKCRKNHQNNEPCNNDKEEDYLPEEINNIINNYVDMAQNFNSENSEEEKKTFVNSFKKVFALIIRKGALNSNNEEDSTNIENILKKFSSEEEDKPEELLRIADSLKIDRGQFLKDIAIILNNVCSQREPGLRALENEIVRQRESNEQTEIKTEELQKEKNKNYVEINEIINNIARFVKNFCNDGNFKRCVDESMKLGALIGGFLDANEEQPRYEALCRVLSMIICTLTFALPPSKKYGGRLGNYLGGSKGESIGAFLGPPIAGLVAGGAAGAVFASCSILACAVPCLAGGAIIGIGYSLYTYIY
ncbi:hypothetical protein Mgra_00003803, partial [Meloidogyne graminicola]